MAYEQKDNAAVLFPNKFKKEEKEPDYKGQGMIDGTMKSIIAWENNGKSGKYLNIKLFEYKPKE